MLAVNTGSGGTREEELQQKWSWKDKYRLWEVNDPNMPNSVREKWEKIEPILARSDITWILQRKIDNFRVV